MSTALLTRSRPSTLPCGRWPFSHNTLRSDGAFLEAWHRNCPSMERSRADMQEALAAFLEKRRPDCSRWVRERGVVPGPMHALQPSGYPAQPMNPVLSLIEPTTARV